MGGHRTPSRRSRWQAAAALAVALTLVLALASCGGGDSSGGDEPTATYPVEIVTAEFPTRQRLGQTSLLELGIRNAGDEDMPALTVTVTVGGEEGLESELPFGYRTAQPGVAQPDRPVWVLAADYPKLVGETGPGGTETANDKTFEFGPVAAGEEIDAVWKLSAVRTGSYKVLYEVGAGSKGSAETVGGGDAGGSFAVNVTEVPPDTVVTDSGEVVPAPKPPTKANR